MAIIIKTQNGNVLNFSLSIGPITDEKLSYGARGFIARCLANKDSIDLRRILNEETLPYFFELEDAGYIEVNIHNTKPLFRGE